jgi:hypothetical protein
VSNTDSVGTTVIGEAVGGTVNIESPENGSRKELLPTWFPVGNILRSRRKAQEHAVLHSPLGIKQTSSRTFYERTRGILPSPLSNVADVRVTSWMCIAQV